MTTLLVAPNNFTAVSGNQQTTAPISNLRLDEPGMVWRSTSSMGGTIKVQTDGKPWDTIALVDFNSLPGDIIRIRASTTSTAVDGTSGLLVDQTFTAGVPYDGMNKTILFRTLTTATTANFIRIDIDTDSATHPAGYHQASRLVIGKRVITDGVAIGADQTFEDGSNVEEGPGYTTVDEYGVRIGWKVTLEGIKDANYNQNFFPFLRAVGKKKAFLFIPDDTSPYLQTQAIFGRITTSAKGASPVADYNNVELNILSVS